MVDAFGTFDEGAQSLDFNDNATAVPATDAQTAWPSSQFGTQLASSGGAGGEEDDYNSEELALIAEVE